MAKTRKRDTALSKLEPARSMGPLEEMERWFDEAFPRAWMHRWGWPSWNELSRPMERMAPRMDVVEHDDEVVVRAQYASTDAPALQVSALKNPGRIRSLSILVRGSNGSGGPPLLMAGETAVPMSAVADSGACSSASCLSI